MTSPTAAGTRARPSRPPARVAGDIAVGVIFALLGGIATLVAVATAGQYGAVNDGLCTAGSYPGVQCDAGYLSAVTIGMTVVAVLGWAVLTGMFVVRLVQRRYGWYFPVLGFALAIAVVWIGSALVAPALDPSLS
jgi:hypothetical protein